MNLLKVSEAAEKVRSAHAIMEAERGAEELSRVYHEQAERRMFEAESAYDDALADLVEVICG